MTQMHTDKKDLKTSELQYKRRVFNLRISAQSADKGDTK